MGAVPRDIARQPHCCLTWAIGECSMQGEGWAGWGPGQRARGFLTQSESRAPQGSARYRPRGWGQRCSGLPAVAGARRGFGDVPGARGSVGRCWVAGMGPRQTLLGCPLPFHGARPRQRLAGHEGGLGRMGPRLSPARACGPFEPVDTSARTLSWDSPWLPSVQCSQALPWLPPTSLTPSPTGPQLPAPPAPLPQPRAPSHPALLSPLFSHLLQAMAAAIALVLAVLAVQHGLKHDPHIDVATAERMQQREEYLHQQMTWLLQEIERSRGTEEATLPSVLQQWTFWTAAGALVLLANACWLAREMKLASDSCSEQDSSSSEEEDDEEEEDLNGADNGARSLAVSTPSPMQGLPDTCKVLKELVGDLLGACRVLCKRTFMPQMHPAIGMDGTYEAWSVRENSIAYSLLVLLRPPPGHSFSLELDTTGQLPARRSSIQVVLECTCSREQLLGESWCFLHHPDDKLPRDQSSYLLRTLCTCSCLDVAKIACWVQLLVRSAWLLLPQSQHCQLTVLPSSQSCRFQLTSTSNVNNCTEMIFAVQQGSSGAYPSLE